MQLLIGMSMSLNAEPMGTAGIARWRVRGLFVSPPARMTARTLRAMFLLSKGARALQKKKRERLVSGVGK